MCVLERAATASIRGPVGQINGLMEGPALRGVGTVTLVVKACGTMLLCLCEKSSYVQPAGMNSLCIIIRFIHRTHPLEFCTSVQ